MASASLEMTKSSTTNNNVKFQKGEFKNDLQGFKHLEDKSRNSDNMKSNFLAEISWLCSFYFLNASKTQRIPETLYY